MEPVVSNFTTVAIMVKPDAIEGPKSFVSGILASDAARAFTRVVLGGEDFVPAIATTESAVAVAAREVEDIGRRHPWMQPRVMQADACRARALRLATSFEQRQAVSGSEIIFSLLATVCMRAVSTRAAVLTNFDYDIIYGDSDDPDLHKVIRYSMANKPVIHAMIMGPQGHFAIQSLKLVLRRVCLRPSPLTSAGGGWLHVTDADSPSLLQCLSLAVAQRAHIPHAAGHGFASANSLSATSDVSDGFAT